jgi:hypothetical protein
VDQLPTTFLDERGREWTIKLTVPVLYGFCRTEHLTLETLSPVKQEGDRMALALTVNQLLSLAYEGTRYQARATARPESLEEFLTSLDGPSFLTAQTAAVGAVVNFFLRMAPKDQPAGSAIPVSGSLGAGVPFSG